MTVTQTTHEEELVGFIETLPAPSQVNVRSMVHAWQSGGGSIAVGKLTVRLLAGDPSFTAGTIHAPRGETTDADLEISRVLLEQHGVDWVHWSDEFADLAHHGFNQAARFPTIQFDAAVSPGEVARLVTGLRDLAAMVN